MLIVKIKEFVYLVAFVEDEEGKFFKTIIPKNESAEPNRSVELTA